jgi:hypothetical protein
MSSSIISWVSLTGIPALGLRGDTNRSTLVSKSADRPVLPRDDPASAPGTVTHAGVDPTLEGRALRDALRAAIATRRGYCSWDVDHACWIVTLHSAVETMALFGRAPAESSLKLDSFDMVNILISDCVGNAWALFLAP